MTAKIIYTMEYLPHPFDTKRRSEGEHAWCLCKQVIPEIGRETFEAVAIFNFDSEAQLFQNHVFLSNTSDTVVKIHEDARKLAEKL